jgi:hypothetical protein
MNVNRTKVTSSAANGANDAETNGSIHDSGLCEGQEQFHIFVWLILNRNYLIFTSRPFSAES